MADDNDIERLEQRLEKNRAQRNKIMIWLALGVPISWLAIFGLIWLVPIFIAKVTASGIQQVNVDFISWIVISVSVASFAASMINAPSYIAVRQLSRDIEADEIALKQTRKVRDIILLRNTTDLEKSEIEELLKNTEAEPQNKTQNKRKRWGKLLSWIFWFRKK